MTVEEFEGWIDAGADRPEELMTVLVYTTGGNVTLGAIYEGSWRVDFPPWELSGEDSGDIGVVCWRHLPRPGLDY